MTPKERHFEFMKIGLTKALSIPYSRVDTGETAEQYDKNMAESAMLFADVALAEFEERWPEDDKLEKLAELEHEQWVEWSKNLSQAEELSAARMKGWFGLWKPYSELTEGQKEQDRIWARKVMEIINT